MYDLSPVTLSATSSGVLSGLTYSPTDVTRTQIGGSEDHTKVVSIDKTTAVTAQYILGGSIETRASATHPMKAPLNNGGAASIDEILMWSIAATSHPLSEQFNDDG